MKHTRDIAEKQLKKIDKSANGQPTIEKFTSNEAGKDYILNASTVLTEDEVFNLLGLDKEVWECYDITGNKYGTSWQTKCRFRRKSLEDMTPEDYVKRFIELLDMQNVKLPFSVEKRETSQSGKMAEICVFDFHFGQLSWGDETGDGDYNIEIAASLMDQTIDYFIDNLPDVEKIILPIGNDFFNSDNAFNTTYSGTPQAESDRWKRTFFSAENLYIKQINKLSRIAPVEIKIVPGNHDRTRAFFLGEFLRAWYRNDENVEVDNGAEERKYVEWGKNMIMYCHGDGLHKKALPLLLVQERPEMYARTKYHEIHKGHIHQGSEKNHRVSQETMGIKEIIIPSLVPLDDWHKGKGYRHLCEATMNVYDKERGKCNISLFHP